jgi:hypothetical protein
MDERINDNKKNKKQKKQSTIEQHRRLRIVAK